MGTDKSIKNTESIKHQILKKHIQSKHEGLARDVHELLDRGAEILDVLLVVLQLLLELGDGLGLGLDLAQLLEGRLEAVKVLHRQLPVGNLLF